MKAKDTVKHADDCSWHGFMTGGALGDKKLHYECTCGREEQAEISFKAGEQLALEKQGQAYLEGEQAGTRKVAEWIEDNCDIGRCDPVAVTAEWQAKLKEWFNEKK